MKQTLSIVLVPSKISVMKSILHLKMVPARLIKKTQMFDIQMMKDQKQMCFQKTMIQIQFTTIDNRKI